MVMSSSPSHRSMPPRANRDCFPRPPPAYPANRIPSRSAGHAAAGAARPRSGDARQDFLGEQSDVIEVVEVEDLEIDGLRADGGELLQAGDDLVRGAGQRGG